MNQQTIDKIKNDPNYINLVKKRNSFAIVLSILMLAVYFAFILTIAFNPSILGTPIWEDSVVTVGIPVGIFVILFAFLLTGIYTKRANSEFDDLSNKIKQSVKEQK